DGIQGEGFDDVGVNRFVANQAPVLDNGGVMQLPSIAMNATSNVGVRVRDLIASAGGDRITDADAGSPEGIAVINVDNTNGRWQFSVDGGQSWRGLRNASVAKARLLSDNGATRIRFKPAADY